MALILLPMIPLSPSHHQRFSSFVTLVVDSQGNRKALFSRLLLFRPPALINVRVGYLPVNSTDHVQHSPSLTNNCRNNIDPNIRSNR